MAKSKPMDLFIKEFIMAQTDNYSIPYPSDSDTIDIAYHMQSMAVAIESNMNDLESSINAAHTLANSAKTAADAAQASANVAGSNANLGISKAEEALSETATLDGRVTNLEQGKVDNMKLLCIGDSYLEGYTASTNWGTLLASNFGCELAEKHLGGAGFYAGTKRFHELINDAYSDGVRDVTHIVVAGGINDCNAGTNAQNMVEGLNTVIATAASKYPNAELHIFPMLWTYWGYGMEYEMLVNAMVQRVANQHNDIKVVIHTGCWTWLFGNSNAVSSDGIHPNTSGQNIIAGSMYQEMNGGNATVMNSHYTTTVTGNNASVECDRDYMMVTISCSGATINQNEKITTLPKEWLIPDTLATGFIVGSPSSDNANTVGWFITNDKCDINCFGISGHTNGDNAWFNLTAPLKGNIHW